MTLLHKAFEDKKFDVRLVEKNISRGFVSVDDVQQSLEELPDDAENAEYISLDVLLSEGGEVCPSEQASTADSNQTHH